MTTSTIAYLDAIEAIAAPLADRSAYLVVTPPALVDELYAQLAALPTGWTAYLHGVHAQVLATDSPAVVAVTSALCPPGSSAAVITVPKTTPAATLSAALGRHVPDDGSQDLIMLCTGEEEPIVWPVLFLDALQLVDPGAAAQVRALSAPL